MWTGDERKTTSHDASVVGESYLRRLLNRKLYDSRTLERLRCCVEGYGIQA